MLKGLDTDQDRVLLVLIGVQTIYKGYQKMSKIAISKDIYSEKQLRVMKILFCF